MRKSLNKHFPPSIIARDITYGRFNETTRHVSSKLVNLILDFINSCVETDLPGVCAQMSFIILGAIIPTMLFIILLCSQFVPAFNNSFLNSIQVLLPSAGFNYIKEELFQMLSYLSYIRPVIIIMSLFFGILTCHTIITGLNQTYGFKPYSSDTKVWFKSFLLLIVIALIIIIAFFVYRTTHSVANEVLQTTPVREYTDSVDLAFRAAAGVAAIFLGILGLFTFVPERRISITESWPGAVLSTIGVIVVYRIYLYFLDLSKNYLVIYGSLAGLFILLVSLFFLNMIINIGVKVNVFISFIRYDRMHKS